MEGTIETIGAEENATFDYGYCEAQNNGNLNVLIIVVAVCAVLGLILGIIFGRRAANK